MPHTNNRQFKLCISLLLVANFHEAALASQSDDGTPLYQCWENWSHHFVLVLSQASLLSQCGQTTKDNTVILPPNTYRKEHYFTSAERHHFNPMKGYSFIGMVRVVFELKLSYRRILIISLFFCGIVVVLVDLWCSPVSIFLAIRWQV